MSAPAAPHSLVDAYGRYGALIAMQLEALERGDLESLEPLALQRERLAGEIEALRIAGAADPAELHAAVRSLESCVQADLQLRRKLDHLQAEIVRSSGRVERDRIAVRTYADASTPGGTIDFSL